MPNLNPTHEHIIDPAHAEIEEILSDYVRKNPLTRFCAYIENNKQRPDKVTDGGLEGFVGDQYAKDIKCRSKEDRLNVFMVTGKDTNYLIDGVDFELYGHGCNDFSGVGAAVCASDGAKLTLRNAKIITHGAIRPALRTDNAEVYAYDCELRTLGGGLTPENFTPPEDTGVWFPPAGLKLDGDCRSVLTMNGGKTVYNRCTVFCDAWGALATDCALGYVLLVANDCKVICDGNGYITYSDDDTHVVLNNCEMISATVGGIQAGESDLSFHGCKARCGQHFVMIHEVLNDYQTIGLSRITDCDIECGGPVVLIKEAACDCYIARSRLKADNGVLIRMMVSDDENVTKLRPDEVSFGANITMDDMEAEGDIINEVGDRDIILRLTETSLTGAMKNVVLQLFNVSKWMATADSEITLVGPVADGAIDAKAGVTIRAKAGEGCMLSGKHILPSGGVLEIV